MLILQRKNNQSLSIGDNITVSIVEIGNDWVKLAIDAPKEISILRTELLEAASANQEAASSCLNEDSISKIKDLMSQSKNSGNT
ncbi:MAG: carbon storage regulator CsrA [Lacrimispora sphenoides]|uniref:Translational regulator CsrA n=1 Tax=Lacrimispora sphenoides JCM 1415 TaxID=1297793 RepID=A0ABY1CCT5_9FIRM|nr:carbon storage regulator CsrA [Lacrimispora sphenoides]SET93439.1 carbon storage regulator [[Clostridium] sphenoides JCM 1415]SUY52492.1 carbon storage regulator CsrA [Lacrimispora sphenoides]